MSFLSLLKTVVTVSLGIVLTVTLTSFSLNFVGSFYYLEGVEKLPNLTPYGTMPSKPTLIPIFKLGEMKKGKLEAICTAFVIDANYALTAGHCLVDDEGRLLTKKLRAMDADDNDLNIELTPAGVNNRMDVGLIRGDFNKFEPLPVDFYQFSPGTMKASYMACGYPYGQRKLTCVPFLPQSPNYFAISGQGFLVPGMSGGPLIDITHGFVLGINSSANSNRVNMSSTIGQLGAFEIEPKAKPVVLPFKKK